MSKPTKKEIAAQQSQIQKDLAKARKKRELTAREASLGRGIAKAQRGQLTQAQVQKLIVQQRDIHQQKRSL